MFKIEDCTKVMDHIKKNIDSMEPENLVARNQVKSIEKCCQALLHHAPSDEMCTAMKASQAMSTWVDNVNCHTKMAKVEFDDSNSLNKITEKF